MPSGGRVQVDVYYWGMDIFVTGLPRDAGKTLVSVETMMVIKTMTFEITKQAESIL